MGVSTFNQLCAKGSYFPNPCSRNSGANANPNISFNKHAHPQPNSSPIHSDSRYTGAYLAATGAGSVFT